EGFLDRTGAFWRNWAHDCDSPDCLFAGPWHDLVVRSGLILKMLTNADNGAIAAAATTSLPEVIGGVRNWDYRFAWIRDSALTVQALYHLGHDQEAEHFRAWINGIVDAAHDSGKLRILYPLRGGDTVPEQILENLSGYKDSGPVRIGNKASDQRQLDIYGELLNTLYETTRYGRDVPKSRWHVVKGIVEHVCATWDEKDSGIWEARSEPKEYTYSKLMCWVAVDRGIKIALQKGFEAPLDTWHAAANAIRKDILNRGFSKRLNSFVRSFDTEDLDAASLQIPFTGFLPFSDERVQGTIDAVIRHLTAGEGLVLRYRAEDGLPGAEGSFALCSLWLVKALSLSGRNEEAEKLFTKILDYMSPLGLISEEIDPATGMLLGNMPQAFSHTGIINAALHIGIGRGKSHRGPEPMGEEHREKGGERWREHYQHRAGQH
ncbi:MAG: glycoside hydrolase family 15 protein, partial [Thermodesulfovibrionales bacterium]